MRDGTYYTPFKYTSFSETLQIISISADADIFPLVELGDRLGQDAPDGVVAIATQQDHRCEFSVLRDPLAFDDIYHDIHTLLRISGLIVVVG